MEEITGYLGMMFENPGQFMLTVQLQALQKDGKLNILSSPSITTLNNQKATIESGKEVPFQTVEDGDIKIEFKPAVIKLEVTPHVISDSIVKLEIITNKDELDWSRTVNGNPTIIKKLAETGVVLFDGQTTVIAGLSKSTSSDGDNGIPWLKDIPILGNLFKNTKKSSDMEELLIFITPRILDVKNFQEVQEQRTLAKEAAQRRFDEINKIKQEKLVETTKTEIEISLYLKRGLNVVCGDVGTGKTTICRKLIRNLSSNQQFEVHLVLDPTFIDSSEFLKATGSMLLNPGIDFSNKSDSEIREMMKVSLFRKGVNEEKTVVLIIDEGQKIPVYCLELLRELLNYETNEHKLLQIVIFAQKEFEQVLKNYHNFTDRINLKFQLGPLSYKDTKQMIEYRVKQSRINESNSKLFTLLGLLAVYYYTKGYPRKIINLCHKITLAMIINESKIADLLLVRSIAHETIHSRTYKKRLYLLFIIVFLSAGYFITTFDHDTWQKDIKNITNKDTVSISNNTDKNTNKPNKKHVGINGVYPNNNNTNTTNTNKKTVGINGVYPNNNNTNTNNTNKKTVGINGVYPNNNNTNTTNTNKKTVGINDVYPNNNNTNTNKKHVGINGVYPNNNNTNTTNTNNTNTNNTTIDNNLIISNKIKKSMKKIPGMPANIPHYLGSAKIKKGECIGDMVHALYGSYTKKNAKAVIDFNKKWIPDVNDIAINTKIRFPVILDDIELYDSSYIAVELGVYSMLNNAFKFKRIYSKNINTRILPFWSIKEQSIQFTLIINNFFFDKTTALNRIKELPDNLQKKAVVKYWQANTLFFAVTPN